MTTKRKPATNGHKPKPIRKLSDLKTQRVNANKGNAYGLSELDKSVRRDGYSAPMVAAADGELFIGSKRLERSADVYGLDVAPIVVESDGTRPIVHIRTDIPNADDPRAKRLGVADNVISALDWNPDGEVLALLAAEDAAIAELVKHDKLAARAVTDFGNESAGADAAPQLDRANELQKKWRVESGDLWRIGEHRLLCGNCTDKATVARVMGGERASLVVTSPPYAVGKEYEEGVTFEKHLEMLRSVADRCIESVVPGGFIFTNFGEIAPQSHAGPLTGSKRQCIYLISKDYYAIFHDERKCDLYAQRIWYKPFHRLQQPFWSYKTSIPHYQEWEHIWTWRTPGGNGDKVNDWDISVHAVWDTRDEATDDKPLTRHSAAFPVCLPERAIKAHSDAGDIILDPFLGSGTALVACQNLGRRGRGIEISPAYCAVVLERMATAFPGISIERVSDDAKQSETRRKK